MKAFLVSTLIALVGFVCGCCPCAAPIDVVSISHCGVFAVPSRTGETSVAVRENPEGAQQPRPEERLELRILDAGSGAEVSKKFTSSYGQFRLDLVDLDGDGTREFVFVLGEGRGTSARNETLIVERREGHRFVRLFTVPFSGYYGPGLKWWYQLEYRRDQGAAHFLRLVLNRDPQTSGVYGGADEAVIPKKRIITWHGSGQIGGGS